MDWARSANWTWWETCRIRPAALRVPSRGSVATLSSTRCDDHLVSHDLCAIGELRWR